MDLSAQVLRKSSNSCFCSNVKKPNLSPVASARIWQMRKKTAKEFGHYIGQIIGVKLSNTKRLIWFCFSTPPFCIVSKLFTHLSITSTFYVEKPMAMNVAEAEKCAKHEKEKIYWL